MTALISWVFDNFKTPVLLALLLASMTGNVVQRFQHESMRGTLFECRGNVTAQSIEISKYESALKSAQAMRVQQEQEVRVREQEAAVVRQQSQKRTNQIMAAPVPADCNRLWDWMIEQALQNNH